MADETPRFALPLLAAGQAQKEVLHNEAITQLECLAQPIAETIGDNTPPPSPINGASWVVGSAPTGEWAGQADTFASWTEGGWRFAHPIEGMIVYVKATACEARYRGGAWIEGRPVVAALYVGADRVVSTRQPAIAAPAGGATIDSEARATFAALLGALRVHGLIAT